MEILKVLNNNTLLTKINTEEFIVIGKGVGFQKKIGDIIDEKLIEKKFSSYNIPIKYYELVIKIIKLAEEKLKVKFNNSIYSNLTSHIYNAIIKQQQGFVLKNSLLNEIKIIYRKEFEVALDVISYIFKETDVLLTEDEAGFITIHFVNELNDNKKDYEIMLYVNEIENILFKHFKIDPLENFSMYSQLVTHLKYLIMQKYDKIPEKENIADVYYILKLKYRDVFSVIDEINEYIKYKFNSNLNKSEYVRLMIYIKGFMEVEDEKLED